MVRELRLQWPEASIYAFDIEPADEGREGIVARPFWFDYGPERYDLLLTNPPFSECLMFAQLGLTKLAPGGAMALLLPLAFLESRERRGVNRTQSPHHFSVLSERVSFTGDALTDSRAVAWFVWRNTGRKHATRLTVF